MHTQNIAIQVRQLLHACQSWQAIGRRITCCQYDVQIDEEQWWDIDRDELPADRPVYQNFN